MGSPPFPERLPLTSLLSGSGRGSELRALRGGRGGRGGDICMEWQPQRVGTLAGTLAGSTLPFISPVLTSDPAAAAVTAYFGVSHSGRVRSGLQQPKPPRQRQCLPRPLRHRHCRHLHPAPGSHLPAPAPSASAPGPSLFPAFSAWSCCFSSGTLGPSFRVRGLDCPGHSLCTSLSALWVGALAPTSTPGPSASFPWGL